MGKNEVKYGATDLLSREELTPDQATIAISLRVPGDLLVAFKELAAKDPSRRGYQTLMIERLRDSLKKADASELVHQLLQIQSGVTRLEGDMIRAGLIAKRGSKVQIEVRGGRARAKRRA